MPRPDNEASNLITFTQEGQNTHRQVVARSVGVTILQLTKTYFKGSFTEADLSKNYDKCINEIKSAAKGNHRHEGGVKYLIDSANQPENAWDNITLYLPDTAGKYHDKLHTFPIRQVIILVWHALRDHEKFAHDFNYPPDSNDSRVMQKQLLRASGEYIKRKENFLNLLVNLHEDTICHQGIRNEIVFLLNKIYLNVEIIEDELSTIAAILKDNANTLFWQHYQNARTPDVKVSLTKALYTWMQEYNPTSLLSLIDPEKNINASLHTLFLRHGCNPIAIRLDDLIAQCLPTLNFTYDPKTYPVIKLIENIFISTEETNSVNLQRALQNISAWITAHVALDNAGNTDTLNAFYTLYRAYKSLDERMKRLLMESGKMQDSYAGFLTASDAYFTVVADANLENTFPTVNPELLQIAQKLKTSIDDFNSSAMVDFIENFFARWNIAVEEENIAQLKYLYKFLLDDAFKQKIIYSDAEIGSFWNSGEEDSIYRDITVYQINRVFLHAIIVDPNQWTQNFYTFVNNVYDFLAESEDEEEEEEEDQNPIIKRFIETSFTTELAHQINYNMGVYIKFDLLHPRALYHYANEYIFLPEQAKTFAEWVRLARFLNEEKHLELYLPQAVKINQQAYECLGDTKSAILFTTVAAIPQPYRCAFMLNDHVKDYIIKNVSEPLTEYRMNVLITFAKVICQLIPEEERITIWNSLPDAITKSLFFKLESQWAYDALAFLPENNRLAFLTRLCQPAVNDRIWLLLPAADLLKHITTQEPEVIFPFFMITIAILMTKFDLSQKAELIKFMSVWPVKLTSFANRNSLVKKIVASCGDDRLILLKEFESSLIDITKLSTDQNYWDKIFFKDISKTNKLLFLIIFGFDNYKKLFPDIKNIHQIATALGKIEFYQLTQAWDSLSYFYIINHPKNTAVVSFLKLLPPERRLQELQRMLNSPGAEKTYFSDIESILKAMPQSNRFEFAVIHLRSIHAIVAEDGADLPIAAILQLLPLDKSISYLKKVGEDFIVNQIANGKLTYAQLLASLPADPDILFSAFTQTFLKIYTALRAGQTSFFKTDMLAKTQLNSYACYSAFTIIMEYAKSKPNSRTAKALALMKKYDSYKHTDNDLLNEIYHYSYLKSGFFKRHSLPPGSISRTQINGVTETKVNIAWGHYTYFQFPDTRRGKISGAMLARDDDEINNFEGRPA